MARRYCQEREGTATWNSPLRRSHVIVTTVVAAPVRRRRPSARPSPVRPPSYAFMARRVNQVLGIASKPVFLGTSPVARTSPVAPARRRRPIRAHFCRHDHTALPRLPPHSAVNQPNNMR